MIVIKGDTSEVREYMRKKRRETVKGIKELERSEVDREKLKELRAAVAIYTQSYSMPVQIETIVINGKLLEKFLKRISGMPYEFFLHEDKLRVCYGEKPGKFQGVLELQNLSKYFKEPIIFPRLVIKNGRCS